MRWVRLLSTASANPHCLNQTGVGAYGEGVYAGLHQEDFALHHHLQDFATEIPVAGAADGTLLLDFGLDVRQEDGLSSYYGYGFVHHALVLLGVQGEAGHQQGGQNDYFIALFHRL